MTVWSPTGPIESIDVPIETRAEVDDWVSAIISAYYDARLPWRARAYGRVRAALARWSSRRPRVG